VPLLSVAQVAATLGISKSTVRRLLAYGHLPHLRILKSVRIPPEAVDGFIAKGIAETARLTAPQRRRPRTPVSTGREVIFSDGTRPSRRKSRPPSDSLNRLVALKKAKRAQSRQS
jgi:excisionase family DNA binding protein